MKLQLRFCIGLFLIQSVLLHAQTQVSGTVTFRGKPISDVSVTLKDSYDGSTTNQEGFYSFTTEETGPHTLVFSHPKYTSYETAVNLNGQPLKTDAQLAEQFSEIDAVVISAGSIEASDRNRATVLLSPLDIYTTAGANGQITAALETLPGVQKVGDMAGLFVRGGSGRETRFYIDGTLVNTFFGNTVPGLKAMDRLDTSLFKGNVFSSGGYSAAYGQALSSVLILESIDIPDENAANLSISPLFISGGYQYVNQNQNTSAGINTSYSNLGLMTDLLSFNTDFKKAPESIGTKFNFHHKTKSGGMFKYYGSLDANRVGVQRESLELEADTEQTFLKGKNTFHSLSFRQKTGAWLLQAGASATYNKNEIDQLSLQAEEKIAETEIIKADTYFNVRATAERKINRISAVRAGIEYNDSHEITRLSFLPQPLQYDDHLTAGFAETDLAFSKNFSVKAGVRTEYSDLLKRWNIAPRLAAAYRFSKNLTASLATGMYYQTPEMQLIGAYVPDYERATHYVFQLEQNISGRNLRLEGFYKKYDHLVQTKFFNHQETAVNNDGKGYAGGAELFWRDHKTLPGIDYWISYSYLDSRRNDRMYDRMLFPDFAAGHTASLVAKKFVTRWKTGFNVSYTYATGRPYYHFQPDATGSYILQNRGTAPAYSALNISLNYLPNLGKADRKSFIVFVLALNNVLGEKNVYGYQFSRDGLRSRAVTPASNSFIFVGAFISFGTDRTEEAINNNL